MADPAYRDSSYTDDMPSTPVYPRIPNGLTDPVSKLNGVANSHSAVPSVVRKKLMGYVGFANLPNQVHRKSVRKGFQFTAMVVGTRFNLLFFPFFEILMMPPQASLGWANPHSLTHYSIPPYILPRSLCLQAQRGQKPSQLKV